MRPATVISSINASDIGQDIWSGSGTCTVPGPATEVICMCTISPSPSPFPAAGPVGNPSGTIQDLANPGTTYTGLWAFSSSSADQVGVRINISPPTGGFTNTTLTVTVKLNYTGK